MSLAPPASAWRAVRLAALALLIIAGGAIVLIAAGAFDPLPGSPPTQATAPGPLSLPGRGEALHPQPNPFAGSPQHSWLRLTAAWQAGELDSAYGLRLGDENNGLTVAVSPLGYATVWASSAGETIELMPWQTWPHVYSGDEANEIWLEIWRSDDRAQVAAWVNRELLWQGNVAPLPPGAALWLASFGNPVTVEYRALEWWEA